MKRKTKKKSKPLTSKKKKSSKIVGSKKAKKKSSSLSSQKLLQIYKLMVQSRALEERLIKVYKRGDGYFWIGGPGEEAFGVPLGLLAKKGSGIKYDYFHLHYRATPTLLALGMDPKDSLRLIMNRSTDVCTGGRNFCNHYCFSKWNVVPVTSPIELQYSVAIGTAHVQRQTSTDSITIVTGGDAGTAEGDFASALVWASRPKEELPMLITVQNNKWGISTSYDTQHGEQNISDRGKAFGIKTMSVNGNDPIETYQALKEAIDYIRKTRKPVLFEAHVSRLYGHSSADGLNYRNETCCIKNFETVLKKQNLITDKEIKKIKKDYEEKIKTMAEEVRQEPSPEADSVWDHVYAENENSDWRKF